MNRTLKTIRKGAISIAVFAIVICLAMVVVIWVIDEQRNCEWGNIDNIELHTGIDIPKIARCDCEYLQRQEVKKVRFEIDESVDVEDYIRQNGLVHYNTNADLLNRDYLVQRSDSGNVLVKGDFYTKKGITNKASWKALFDKETRRLWLTIDYN